MNEKRYKVRILLEVIASVDRPLKGDVQAETPWTTAASLLDYAAGWNSDAEYRVLYPSEPEGEHYFGIVLDPEAESLWCSKHLAWEAAAS